MTVSLAPALPDKATAEARTVLAALGRLPESEQAAIGEIYFRGHRHVEAARRLAMPPPVFARLLASALQRLGSDLMADSAGRPGIRMDG